MLQISFFISGFLAYISSTLIGYRNTLVLGCLIGSLSRACGPFVDSFVPSLLLISLTNGIGASFVLAGATMSINAYATDSERHVALVITLAGNSVMVAVIPLIYKGLMHVFDFKSTLLLLSGIILNAIPLALLSHDAKPSRSTGVNKHRWGIFRSPKLYLIVFTQFYMLFSLNTMHSFMAPTLSLDFHLPLDQIANISAISGFMRFGGKVFVGILQPSKHFPRWFKFSLCFFTHGVALLLYANPRIVGFYPAIGGLYVVSFLLGIELTLLIIIISDFFDQSVFDEVYSCFTVAMISAAFLAPLFAGLLLFFHVVYSYGI